MAARLREFNAVEVRPPIDCIEPQIWPRLVVPLHFNLREPPLVLQAAFVWMNPRMDELEIDGLTLPMSWLKASGTTTILRSSMRCR